MLNLAQLPASALQPGPVETPFAEIAVPVAGRTTDEGDSMVLLIVLLRARASALEYQLMAADAARRGSKLVTALAKEAAAMERRLAEQAMELSAKLAKPAGKVRPAKAK